MESSSLEQRSFVEIKKSLEANALVLKKLCEEDTVEFMTKEWRYMARRRIALLRHEIDAMQEWFDTNGVIDSSRTGLARAGARVKMLMEVGPMPIR